jgi:precorrin-6A/cobalt-precorrin-6A reductase
MPASIEACTNNDVKLHDIGAMMGPFSEELNMAMFQEYHAEYVIMKNSGAAGGTPQKIAACRRLGITPVIIGRHDENGVSDLETLVKLVHKKK